MWGSERGRQKLYTFGSSEQVRHFLEDKLVPSAGPQGVAPIGGANACGKESAPTSRAAAQLITMHGVVAGHAAIPKRASAHLPPSVPKRPTTGGFASAREMFCASGSLVFHSGPASSGAFSASGPTCKSRNTTWPRGGRSILNARSLGSANVEPRELNAGFKKPRSIL